MWRPCAGSPCFKASQLPRRLFFGALLFLLSERRHVLAVANAELESRVADRTKEILEANTALRREITERQEAEAALQKAWADLVQAGKLSALGQLSAGISHELNQPLMALRSYAENAQTFLGKGRADRTRDNLDRISKWRGAWHASSATCVPLRAMKVRSCGGCPLSR